jgi:probable addiction module antidote protein
LIEVSLFCFFDASDYLDNEQTIAEYLKVALEDPDPEAVMVAVRDAAKARGIATVAGRCRVGKIVLVQAPQAGCSTTV